MEEITLYHNPRCGKSREALKLLQGKKHPVNVVEYLKNPYSKKTLETLLKKLGKKPSEVLRRAEFSKLGLKPASDEKGLLAQMVENPILVERPIAVKGNKAAVGRPPEQVLDIV